MTSVRQTVTTVQTNNVSPALDNSLDALLEDLQTSVAVNGPTPGPGSRAYREVRSHRREEVLPSDGYHVTHLSASNPTTVLAERAVSPARQLQPGEQRSIAYKQVSYQYNTRETQPVLAETSEAADPGSDSRLRQNLSELDSLLVDLHHAQKTGLSSEQVTSSSGVVPSRNGVNSGLLEDISAAPGHVSRVVEQRTYTTRYADQPASPRLQPKRSTSAQRELTYGVIEPRQESPRAPRREVKAATPPRSQYRDKSPSNQRLNREMYYESSKTSRVREPSPPAPKRGVSPDGYPGSKVTSVRSYTSTPGEPYPGPKGAYPGDSPTSLGSYSSTQVVRDTRTYTGGSPATHDGGYPASKVTTVRTYAGDSPTPLDSYGSAQVIRDTRTYTGGSPTTHDGGYPGSKVTTVRTYTGDSPTPLDSYSSTQVVRDTRTYTGGSPTTHDGGYPGSKVTTVRTYTGDTSPRADDYPPGSTKVTTVRSYTNVVPGGRSPSPVAEAPRQTPYRSPSPVQFQPPQPKVTTTVRTYTYELPGDPPHQPQPQARYPEREPLVAPPEPTVITYKYSSHSSHHTNTRFPTGPGETPEDREPLLPRPFPTASPGPGDTQPPKRLDELMASFSDTEVDERRPLPAPSYQVTERQASTPRATPGPAPGESAAPPPAATKASAAAAESRALEQRRGQSKNVAGPPVYYPPGVEMFARKDQSMQMASMKGSGKYEMSRESHSKSSSGGAAVVPVCLPLCCAMPCVIM
ncbi:mucin-2 [Bacillus rossius redtenbacheri]|uniref:mucin-2 n=1 Tax=Bacillus rossius redtenbacheri TaxID=93214 RepID=UPI002FDEF28B